MEQELRISQRAKQYPASGIRKMFDLAAQYPEAIKLTVGEPNFDTPQYIKDAAKRALDEGQKVTFDTEQDPKNRQKLRAVNVCLA